MIEVLGYLGALGVVVTLLWLGHNSGAEDEKLKQMEADRAALAKAVTARNAVATGAGVPADKDPLNRDNRVP